MAGFNLSGKGKVVCTAGYRIIGERLELQSLTCYASAKTSNPNQTISSEFYDHAPQLVKLACVFVLYYSDIC